jgi:LemA protein
MQINEATSNIDVQLAKRKDVLIKLVDATKSSLSFEKDLLKEVTELRNVNMNPSAHNQAKTIKNEQMLNSAFGKLMATFENYPNIKSTDTIVNLMQTADYIEREIAASRRLYNSVVSQFNQKLYVFPDVIPAARLKLCNLPLFIASASQREDVSLKL